MSKPKMCPKCQKEYDIEHLYCSFCGTHLVDNPIYLKEQKELERQKELSKRTYSASDYESAKKELVEKVDFLISHYRRFEGFKNHYGDGVESTIREIERDCEYIKKLLDNKEDLYEIKRKCEEKLKDYYDYFIRKYRQDHYPWVGLGNFFSINAQNLRESTRIWYKNELERSLVYIALIASFTQSDALYPLRYLAVENKPLLEKDIETVDKLFIDLSARVENAHHKERFIEFVDEPELINELLRVVEIANNMVWKYKKICRRVHDGK